MPMILRLGLILVFLLLLPSGVSATPNIVQSLVVNFPVNGRVIVQSREEGGRFPQIAFISERTGEVLLLSSIEDEGKWLIPDESEPPEARPNLRFRVIRSAGFTSPMVMSVGLSHGGSDNGYFLTVFGEVGGKIVRLNEKPMVASVQGGYYLGHLNTKLDYGLAVWNFVWGDGPHYSQHKYEIEIYRMQGGKLTQTLQRITRRMYASDKGAYSLRELGIRATDQRAGIPVIKDSIGAEP
jgi:hypothetical protein